ncbi:MAG TPA: MlaD family protein [Verrucomicrobiae bacterium]|jgi:phospholipid/cholesterol/gamma-HCH transport system substrate-binding protein
MNSSQLAGKVGLFVAIGIVLLALLFMSFSKGLSLFVPTYEVNIHAASVGGLKKNSGVLLSGVTIGNVVDASIPADGSGVLLRLKIQKKYKIHADARWVIEQIGFLGDQYVTIYPTKNQAPFIEPGSTVNAEEPLNFQEIARSASGLIQNVSQTVKILNESIGRIEKTVFSPATLANVTNTLQNFRVISEKGDRMVDGIDKLVSTNAPYIALSVSNLVLFSQDLDKLADEMNATVVTNRIELTKAVKNLERTTAVLERLANDIESGKGLAGSLIKDPQLQANISSTAAHLATLSSNIARYGLLFKPKQPRVESKTIYPGRNPLP